MILNKLYKVDSKGKIRVYYIEIILDQYRMITGVLDGKEVKSKWTTAKPKNLNRANATSGEEQAKKESTARYDKKLAEGYFTSIEEAKANPDGLFFSPMLAATWEKAGIKYKVFPLIADPKLDGMRMTIDSALSPISRKGKEILTAEHIANDLEFFFNDNPTVTLDGELYNHDYKEDFNTLMSIARQVKPTKEDLKLAVGKLEFHVYDCWFADNPNMTALKRKEWLESNLPLLHTVKLVDYEIVNNIEELNAIKEKHLTDGYEGTITRGPNSIYENKRSNWLLKHKDFITEEFEILNILNGKGNRSDIAGTIVVSVNDVKVGCGLRGTHEYCAEITKNRHNLIGRNATIRHFGKTIDGSLRFPVCIDINRND